MVALKTNLWRGLPAAALSKRAFVRSFQEEACQTFQGARVGEFRQEAPRHEHPWRSDSMMRTFLARTIPKEVLEGLEPDLDRFGERVAREVGCRQTGKQTDRQTGELRTIYTGVASGSRV